jgi:hypothetical protein
MNIELTAVNPHDEITIRTQQSEYRFRVSDSKRCRGFLTGGLLGQRHRDSFLAGVIFPEAVRISDSKRLETGARAIFYLKSKRGVHRLITSVITELAIGANSAAAPTCFKPLESSTSPACQRAPVEAAGVNQPE